MVTSVMGQSIPNLTIPHKAPKAPVSIPQKPVHSTATNTFIIDYDSADAVAQFNFGFPMYRTMWDYNYNYVLSDSALKYFVVAFDSLYDTYNGIGYNRNTVTTISCDSIFMILGQENNSGTDDTIRIKLVSVNANGYPTSTVFWTYDQIIPSGSPFGTDWLQPVVLGLNCGYTMTTNDRFALRVEYLGNKMDTCGWIASFGNQAPLGTCTSLAANRTEYSPYKQTSPPNTYYNANTFTLWTQYQSFGLLPTAGGVTLYYECNGVGGYQYLQDGENYLQNMSVWVKVTTDPFVSVSENDGLVMQIGQSKPNPTNGLTTINYELSKQANNVSLIIYDITGKHVINFNEGEQTSGKHDITIDGSALEAGVYFYSVIADGVKITRKMTVVK